MTYKTKVILFIIAMFAITTYVSFKMEVNRIENIVVEHLREDCGKLQLAATMGLNVEYRVRNEMRAIDNADISWIRKQAAKQALRNAYDDCLYE